MVHLYDKETGAKVGTIDEEQFRFLQDQLEEESERDNDYFINTATIEMLSQRGADRALVGLLRTALHGRKETEIRWQR
jgi:hypothetical protein